MRFQSALLVLIVSGAGFLACSKASNGGGSTYTPAHGPGAPVPCFRESGTSVLKVDGHVPVTDATVQVYQALYKVRNPGLSDRAAKQYALEEAILPRAAIYTAYQTKVADLSKRAWEIHARLVKGEKFDELAKSVSDCPTRAQGGVLAEDRGITRGVQGVPAGLEAALFSTEPGKFTEPFATWLGIHILLVREEVPGTSPQTDSRKASHILLTWDKEAYDQNAWVGKAKKLKDEARVEIFEKSYKKDLPRFRWESKD